MREEIIENELEPEPALAPPLGPPRTALRLERWTISLMIFDLSLVVSRGRRSLKLRS
jgi:hypothetical protein